MIREWRHIKLLKRSGRGHDVTGVKGTAQGECAVLCPACPHPGKNLPPDWKDAPIGLKCVRYAFLLSIQLSFFSRFIYILFLALDANFRLCRLITSSYLRDPALNKGSAYFVEYNQFKDFLNKFGTLVLDDVNATCNNHDAIKSASARGGKGIDVSGVGTVECSRHDMKRPVSVGDLQKGERYADLNFCSLRLLTLVVI